MRLVICDHIRIMTHADRAGKRRVERGVDEPMRFKKTKQQPIGEASDADEEKDIVMRSR
jgi:hypothetical protein